MWMLKKIILANQINKVWWYFYHVFHPPLILLEAKIHSIIIQHFPSFMSSITHMGSLEQELCCI